MSRAQQQFLLALPEKWKNSTEPTGGNSNHHLLVTEFIRVQNVLDVPESLRQCLGVDCERLLDVE